MPVKENRRNHPVRLLLDHLASGGALVREDLEELPLDMSVDRPAVERAIVAAAVEIAAARADGHRGLARRVALDVADRLVQEVGAPAPKRAPYDAITDPRALAALVSPPGGSS